MVPLLKLFSLFLATATVVLSVSSENQTLFNPAIPGWHSDPSCVFVAERHNTTFCTSSTFLLTPGLPVHASKDLKNWKLISHALSSKSQYPGFDQSLTQSDGIWAATIRYYKDTFYIITIYKDNASQQVTGLIFKTNDPYNDSAWSDPLQCRFKSIDPDLFWDDDGTPYVATAGTYLQTVDLETGALGEPHHIWNGTTGVFLEGPHLYKKDGYYYIMAAEGGSGLNHSVIIARSTDIWGPYKNYDGNPVLTNRNTSEYFQNIGHADLFHDQRGQWWSSALAWRSGPEGSSYPMGREMVLTPVTWNEGDWPVFSPVRGMQRGWYLPSSQDIPGKGPFVDEGDSIDFEPNSTLPRNFGFWRWPNEDSYAISPQGHPGTLRLKPSRASITAGATNYTAGYEIANLTLVMRVQTDTLFQYNVDISFSPKVRDEEVGVTVFLNQVQNINLGIVMLPTNASTNVSATCTKLVPHFRFLVSGHGSHEKHIPPTLITPVPHSWLQDQIRLTVRAEDETHYVFYAASATSPNQAWVLGRAPATIVSGGDGPFTGSLVGVYATSNGGNGTTESYISRWRYQGLGQAVAKGEYRV